MSVWELSGCLLLVLSLLAAVSPGGAIFLALLVLVIALVSWPLNVRAKHCQAKMADKRSGESICTFARGFDYRRTDTRLIRAVYEELQPRVSFPLRATDRFEADLEIYDDDLELGIAQKLARRTGRSLENPERNDYYGRVRTVEDLVAFFCHQPQSSELPS